ncbi:MAG: Peptidyl-prolyl cis-trans isomerase cyp6 [Claussenomyces sp. TS43310]|nr:MAG: Peptidyl-prolyl cis-trans isomerase cyp6 [Claussenomyces sp. TS43310]
MSVLLETSAGDIVIDLLVDYAPKLCENFLKLCKVKYYNFSPVHSVQKNFSCQTGDPVGPDSKDSDGGSSIWGVLGGPSKRTFTADLNPKLKHTERGTVSMATVPSPRDPDERIAASQFIITLGDDLDHLDGKAAIFGKVVEGFDALEKINDSLCDEKGRPLVDIRIKHTVVLDDPFESDPPGLVEPPESPLPTKAQLATVRIADDENLEDTADPDVIEKQRREREARAQALTLEMVGDLPFAEVKPPENVLFVCKLNPVTTDEDLELIFSRFGTVLSCEVIRDKRTGDSLQYAFIEYAEQASCEQAYFKMQGVLIDDHRIHVDFSQSVSKLSDTWRTATNSKRRMGGGGFGGVSGLEKKSQYKVANYGGGRKDRYGMVYDEDELRKKHERERRHDSERRERTRSRSPRSERRDYDRDGVRRGDGGRHEDDRYHDRDRVGRRGDEYRRR